MKQRVGGREETNWEIRKLNAENKTQRWRRTIDFFGKTRKMSFVGNQ